MDERTRKRRTPLAGHPAIAIAVLALIVAISAVSGPFRAQTLAPGAVVTYRAGGTGSDVAVVPSFALFVPSGAPPTPFLAPGPFTAEFEAQVAVDLRDDYRLRVELSGSARVMVADAVVLTASGGAEPVSTPKPIRLNRGSNRVRVTYTSPPSGDAYLRLSWSSPEIGWEPIPARALSQPATAAAAVARGQQIRTGRQLVFEYRCTSCHRAPESGGDTLEMDAPTFAGIGSRRNQEWMARWIADPRALRPSARMPKLVHGSTAADDAADMAAFLAGQKVADPIASSEDGDPASGEELFGALNCAACHDVPGSGSNTEGKVSLQRVREKFSAGALAHFLRQPNRHFVSIAMPDFKLSEDEAAALSAWLQSHATDTTSAAAPSGDAGRGENLVQQRGCLSCHTSPVANKYAGAPALADIPAVSWTRAWHDQASTSAVYALAPADRAAIQTLARADLQSVGRETPAEFASAQVARLNCARCHDTLERVPRLDVIGGKLRPEWTRALIDGSLPYKPRPWIDARMPAFPFYADRLATGLAAQHGYAAASPADPSPVDTEAADIGRQMVVSGGCANCHNVGDFVGGQTPTTAGINLAHTAERLMYPYFHRWLLNPPRIWPETVMPRYFSGPKGPFPFYDGNVDQQIRALWAYMRLGPDMPAPQ